MEEYHGTGDVDLRTETIFPKQDGIEPHTLMLNYKVDWMIPGLDILSLDWELIPME